MPKVVFFVLAAAAQAGTGGEDVGLLMAQVRGLREQVAVLDQQLRRRDESLAQMGQDLRALGTEVGSLKDRLTSPVAPAFIGGPPPPSDTLGVAKAVVFAPRIEADMARRRELVLVKLRRIEAQEIKRVGEVELGSEGSVDLPIDQNGALYMADWSTAEGASFNLMLRDGASGQVVATVQVKPLQSQGRFLFVGYRID